LIPASQLPSFTPGLNYADASKVYLGDPAPWGGWGHDGTVHDPTTKDTFTEGKFMAKHDVEVDVVRERLPAVGPHRVLHGHARHVWRSW
jgi:hypothetical protein